MSLDITHEFKRENQLRISYNFIKNEEDYLNLQNFQLIFPIAAVRYINEKVTGKDRVEWTRIYANRQGNHVIFDKDKSNIILLNIDLARHKKALDHLRSIYENNWKQLGLDILKYSVMMDCYNFLKNLSLTDSQTAFSPKYLHIRHQDEDVSNNVMNTLKRDISR